MKKTLCLMLILFSVSCNRLQMALDWSDTLLISRVEDYFDLNSEQEKQLKIAYQKTLKEVKKEELQQFSNQLLKIKDQIKSQKLERKHIQEHFDEIQNYILSISIKLEPQAQKLIEEQSKKSFDQFDQEFLDKLSEDRKEWQSLDKIQKNQIESWMSWGERLLGDLTEEQNKMIEAHIQKNPRPRMLQIESRQSVFEKFKLARQKPETRTQFIHQFFSDWNSGRSTVLFSAGTARSGAGPDLAGGQRASAGAFVAGGVFCGAASERAGAAGAARVARGGARRQERAGAAPADAALCAQPGTGKFLCLFGFCSICSVPCLFDRRLRSNRCFRPCRKADL